ncbi:hypothetical protein FIV34_09615 [Luteibacter pinisoli]|uniref:DUF1444 family protein n=1 Tax=Luteibacter pinisoli TaxID=2589080 RepID=A0A4Y5Z2H4_9GAMM|nr:hypothetical protein [Luteibacter pinisoli]QDE39441.1 hypothetical protein FIV34_09615 [Luteibacter pinisoli]
MGLLDIFRRKLSADDFAALVIKRAQALAQPKSARYDAGEFQIHFELADGRPMMMNLHNAYRDTLAAPRAKRNGVIDKYLAGLTGGFDDERPEDVRANLMPVIRDTAMFSWVTLNSRLSGVGKPDGMPCLRPFSDDLSVALVVDSEHATKTVNPGTLLAAGLDTDAAFALAISNLRDRTTDAGMKRHGGVWASTWSDVYDASRLLLTDMIHRLAVHGEPVAAIPSRNNLFVTGSLDDEGIALIAALAADILENDTRPLSSELLVLRDGTWRPFRPNLPADIAQRLALSRYRALDSNYAEQKKLLEKIHEKEGTDLFVATYRAVQQTDTGEITSSAQWTRDVVTLLPHCDSVWLFCHQRNELLDIAWEDAMRHMPELATPYDHLSPPRYLVTRFPDDATYEALKLKATRVREIQPS